jgi:hypothetical protein
MHPLLLKLNLGFDGLEKVKEAADAGDVSQALVEVETYFRNRKEPDSSILAGADAAAHVKKAMAHEFEFYNEPGTVPGDRMDWTYKPGIDWEWTWALNRHGWWPQLAAAYLETKDERYAQELDMLIRTWVGGHPPTVDDRSAWRTIEAGIRTSGAWPAVLSAMKTSPSISRDAWLYYLRSIYDHAEFLLANPKGGNWLLMETNGVLTCGLVFPEFKRAQDWVNIAIEKFEAEMVKQVHPDGAQVEYSTGYQFVCIHNFQAVLDKVDRCQGSGFSQTYRDRLAAMWEHVMYMLRPDGKIPMLNDADQRPVAPGLLQAGEALGREDFVYAATNGEQGSPPEHTSHRFSWVRRAVMRSGWDADALYAMLETAPFGYGHQHEDALTFEIMAYGQPLIGTMGRYTYARVPIRRYLTGSRGHNVVLVDGQEQAMRSLRASYQRGNSPPDGWLATKETDAPWTHTPDLDVAYGKYEGPWSDGLENVTWERRMAFLKPNTQLKRPGLWVVRDSFLGEGEHDLEFLLHFFPGEVSWDEEHGQIVTDYGPDTGNVLAQFVSPDGLSFDAAKGQEDPARGWFSVEYGKVEPAWDVITKRRMSFPCESIMVFVPFVGSNPPKVSAEVVGEDVNVTVDGQVWDITL